MGAKLRDTTRATITMTNMREKTLILFMLRATARRLLTETAV